MGAKKHKRGNESAMTKKGTKGEATQYVTRAKAIRTLQVSLKDFRRLCILKGVYPREPRKKRQGRDKTYYHVKDIKFLMHEPLLHKFRDMKTWLKKRSRAYHRGDHTRVQSMVHTRPDLAVDHLVRERYPRFADALNDLDDPLCMVHLFALLPRGTTRLHSAARAARCQRLAREWQLLIAKTGALRKCFFSVKGVYLQASVQGVDVTWLVPHKFSQQLPTDVDYRVMQTFLEFYLTMIGFVHFKLYHDVGLQYPPVLLREQEAQGEHLTAMRAVPKQTAAGTGVRADDAEDTEASIEDEMSKAKRQSVVDAVVATLKKNEDTDEQAEEEHVEEHADDAATFRSLASGDGEDAADRMQDADEGEEKKQEDLRARLAQSRKSLFRQYTVLLRREVPQDILEFILMCMGAKVVLERPGDARDKYDNDTSITHEITDRPTILNKLETREYVQPQWVFDCLNMNAVLPVTPYAPGQRCPPHLSPFVDDVANGYVPRQRRVLENWARGGSGFEVDEDTVGAIDARARAAAAEAAAAAARIDEVAAEKALKQYQKELRQEQGQEVSDWVNSDGEQPQKVEEEAGDVERLRTAHKMTDEERMRTTMLTGKKKRLYERMQHGIRQRAVKHVELERKRLLAEQGPKQKQQSQPAPAKKQQDARQPIDKVNANKNKNKKKRSREQQQQSTKKQDAAASNKSAAVGEPAKKKRRRRKK